MRDPGSAVRKDRAADRIHRHFPPGPDAEGLRALVKEHREAVCGSAAGLFCVRKERCRPGIVNNIENRETLAGFGILVEEFGGNTVLLSGYPRVLEKSPPKEIFVEILAILMKRGKENIEMEDVLDDILRTCACRAADCRGR